MYQAESCLLKCLTGPKLVHILYCNIYSPYIAPNLEVPGEEEGSP